MQIAASIPRAPGNDPDGEYRCAPRKWIPTTTTLAELSERLSRPPDAAWLDGWREADERASAAIDAVPSRNELSEPRAARRMAAVLPGEAPTLFVASSMPVRDIETFVAGRDDAPRVPEPRRQRHRRHGLHGSGAAAASAGAVVASDRRRRASHDDIGGPGWPPPGFGPKLTVVALDNDGGGIFHFLPVAGETDVFEHHVATPHGLDFAHAAALYGCDHTVVADATEFDARLRDAIASPRTTIVEVKTDRTANRELHGRVWAAVEAALGG